MSRVDFSPVHNHYEQAVFDAVLAQRDAHPAVSDAELADVACVALNRLPARYIRHLVDLLFYLTEHERAELDQAVHQAVEHAFEFVQTRKAPRARA